MAVVTFKIAGRPYKIACADSQQDHILELAQFVDEKANKLLDSVGFIPEAQLLAMVNIIVAQELFSAKKGQQGGNTSKEDSTQIIQIIDSLSTRISDLADVLKQDD